MIDFAVFYVGGASRFKEGTEASSSEDRILHQPVHCECCGFVRGLETSEKNGPAVFCN